MKLCFFSAVSVLFFWINSIGNEICKVQLDCPQNFSGTTDTVRVGKNVVALSNIFRHCAGDTFIESPHLTINDTISLFFIIDHSQSMNYMDSTGLRYRVVQDLIDTIYSKSPLSEIGIAVFSNQLLHSYKDDSFFVQLGTTATHESYIPLTRLDKNVSGMSAVEKLKWAIATSATQNDTDAGGNARLINGNYSPTGRFDSRFYPTYNINNGYSGTTDISLGFEAAKQAFKSASYSRDHQLIVFLSDGVSQNVDVERAEQELDYLQGTDIPTTYTAFFINVNQSIPPQIQQMTTNIQNNGYSVTNTASTVWKNAGAVGDLANKLFTKLSGNGLSGLYTRTPKSMTINGISTTNFSGDSVIFSQLIPLTGNISTLNLSFSWHWNEPWNEDKSADYKIIVAQSNTPDSFPNSCWDQGSIRFFHEGNEISSASENQTTIEVRFYPPPENMQNSAILVIKNVDLTDSLILNTTFQNGYYFSIFNRTYGAPQIDNILQNALRDSIIAFYQNSKYPLDIIRTSIPVAVPRILEVKSAYFLDQNGNGYPDVIRVIQGEDKLMSEETDVILPYISFKETERTIKKKSVTPTSEGFDIILEESGVPYTGIYSDERLLIERVLELPGGGEFNPTNVVIFDSMAPVIISASFYNNISSQKKDTITVTFSEMIDSIQSQQPFIFNHNNTDYKLRLTLEQMGRSDAVFSVVPVAGIQNPDKGDSIRIDHNAGSLGISDLSDIIQNHVNIKRELKYFNLYDLSSASYLDTTGDGLIDIIDITMETSPDKDLLIALYEAISLPSYRKFEYTEEDFNSTDNGFKIKVRQPLSIEPYTSVDSRDVLTVKYTEASNGGIVKPASITIEDKLAPVLISATYIPGTSKNDSLIAKFSESILKPADDKPLSFYNPAGLQYSMILQYAGSRSTTEYFFAVKQVVGKESPDYKDSVSINTAAEITDSLSNVQISENRRSELIFKVIKYDYKIILISNPFDPEQFTLNRSVRDKYGITEKNGIAIIIKPLSRVAGYVELRGRLTIYDAVGNIVTRAEARSKKGTDFLCFVWSGKNLKEEFSAKGTYLGVITIEDNQGNSTVKKTKIGITRKK